MLDKKNYKEIADIFHYVQRNENYNIYALKGIENLQRNLCKYFESDNPRFDAEKFNEACKP